MIVDEVLHRPRWTVRYDIILFIPGQYSTFPVQNCIEVENILNNLPLRTHGDGRPNTHDIRVFNIPEEKAAEMVEKTVLRSP